MILDAFVGSLANDPPKPQGLKGMAIVVTELSPDHTTIVEVDGWSSTTDGLTDRAAEISRTADCVVELHVTDTSDGAFESWVYQSGNLVRTTTERLSERPSRDPRDEWYEPLRLRTDARRDTGDKYKSNDKEEAK
jgi:hypothetical protein